MKKSTFILVLIFFIITSASAQKTDQENENAVSPSTVSLETLIQKKSPTYVITKEHVSRTSGIRHVYLRQAINGLEVYGTESSIHIDKNGTVINSKNNFIKDVEVTLKRTTQTLSASQAIDAVTRQMGYTITNLQQLRSEEGQNKKTLYNKAGISSEDIPVKLMYYYRVGEGTILVWELSIAELDSSDWWNFRVDAATGEIIDKNNWKRECNVLGEHSHESEVIELESNDLELDFTANDATSSYAALFNAADGIGTYNVYAMPIESPFFGARSLVVGPANATASPFGWHDTDGADGAEFTNTRGNNVSAWDDEDANDAPDGAYTASPGGNLVFDFPLNTTYSNGTQSTNAATTNLFYWNNIIHDVLYQYGFDEASGNFQENNYGNGGSDGDSVNAEAQSGLATCNANFWTPTDGNNPRMRMYTCNSRDGDIDNWVIVHEYGHGISVRLTGGAGDSDCLDNDEQMGEGWSDIYGLLLTMQSTDVGSGARGFATWLLGQTANGPGWRNQRYSTDFTENSHTYDDIKTVAGPWPVGEVWATMLWDVTWGLIDEHGFDSNFYSFTGDVNTDAGNIMALALITEGLKLQGCSPGFVDGRDAILAADAAIYGGANECIIWKAFSRRGLGLSAAQGDTDDRTDGTEAFDSPFDAPEALCVADFAIALDENLEVNLTVADIDNGSSVSCGSYSLSIAPKFFTCADLGPNVVTLTLTDHYGDETTCTTTVTIEKHPTTLTYTGDLEEQYSDETNLSALLVDSGGTGLVGETISFTIGSQSTSGVTDANGIATATIILTQDPTPAYTVDVEFVEVACYAGSTDSDVFDITQEDAIVEYTGHLFQATAVNSDIATVVLSANVQDITVTNPDPLAGDIRNATVKFVDRDGGVDISPWIPVVDLFDPSDPTTGTVSWDWDVDLGNLTSKSFTVGIVVGNYYTRDASEDNVVVTVYKPVGDFITGGGFILPDNSAGQYASTDGLKTNFGYNVKYNKKGKKLRGHMNIIFRRLEGDGIHTYQIKGNAIQSLGVNMANMSAKFGEFITKANLQDITDPDNHIPIAGNLRLKVEMTDRGEPGTDDSIGFNLTKTNGVLLYSSNWSGLRTDEMTLAGGNLVVHSGYSMARLIDVFEVLSWPNPTDSFFNLKINTNSQEMVKITIFDINSRLISHREFDPKEEYQFGNTLQSGSYFVRVSQGEKEEVIRLIKY